MDTARGRQTTTDRFTVWSATDLSPPLPKRCPTGRPRLSSSPIRILPIPPMHRLWLLGLLLGSLCVPASAQTIWSRPYEPNQITLEALAAEDPSGASSFPTGAAFLTATRSLSSSVELAVELPVAHAQLNETASSAIGNPYVGLGLSSTRRPLLLELGVRLPAAPTTAAASAGQRADLGRTAAFRDEAVALSGLLNTRVALGRATSLRLRAGAAYGSLHADSTAGDTNAWQALYGAQLWRSGAGLITGLSVVGRPALTDAAETADSAHHAALSLMLDRRRWRPGLLLGIGLDPLVTGGDVTLVGGLTLSISYDR